jgi:preprotein translocase SecE subunit
LDNKPTTGPKRQVKNPETFRERATKATSANDKPKRSKSVLVAPFKLLASIFRPVGKLNNKLKKLKYLKPIYFVFHIIGLILLPKYIRSSFAELKQVNWPNFKLSLRLTWAVLAFAIIFGVSIAILDYGLDKLFKQILLK